MARVTLTKSTAAGTNTYAGVVLTMTAADISDLNQFVASGKDLLVIWNTSTDTPYTFTVTSAADERGRTKDITTEAIVQGVHKIVGPLEMTGWVQTDGKVYLQASNAAVKFGVIALP